MTGKITGALREQSDWEQQDENRLGFIKNKPFYDNRKMEEYNIPIQYTEAPILRLKDTFAELYGKEGYGVYFYKISDLVPSYEEFCNAEIEAVGTPGDGRYKLSDMGCTFAVDKTHGSTMYVGLNAGFPLAVLVEWESQYDSYFSTGKGIYAVLDTEDGVNEVLGSIEGACVNLIINRTTGELKTIDPKFLPSGSVGYTENTKKTLLPEQTFEPKEIHEGAGLYVFDIDPPFSPVVGDKFTVNWNGTRYVCETVSKMQDGYLMLGFGNQGLLNDDGGTGEPFMYSEMEGDTGKFITLGTEPVTVSVIVERETIHTIDPKFLPSGGGGVVLYGFTAYTGGDSENYYVPLYRELPDDPTDINTLITGEELRAILESGKTIIIKGFGQSKGQFFYPNFAYEEEGMPILEIPVFNRSYMGATKELMEMIEAM